MSEASSCCSPCKVLIIEAGSNVTYQLSNWRYIESESSYVVCRFHIWYYCFVMYSQVYFCPFRSTEVAIGLTSTGVVYIILSHRTARGRRKVHMARDLVSDCVVWQIFFEASFCQRSCRETVDSNINPMVTFHECVAFRYLWFHCAKLTKINPNILQHDKVLSIRDKEYTTSGDFLCIIFYVG